MKKLTQKQKLFLLLKVYTNWIKDNKGICTEGEQLYIATLLADTIKKIGKLLLP